MLALVVLDHDVAEHAARAVDRCGHQREGPVGAGAGPGHAGSDLFGMRAEGGTDALAQQAAARHEAPVDGRRGRLRQRLAVFDAVDVLERVGLVVPPADAQVFAAEDLAQLVAHAVDDGLKVELRGHALLDAVDQRQFARALLGLRGALGDLLLQPFAEVNVGQRHGGLGCEHGQQVAVGLGEAAERTFDVGVEVADQFVLRDQRGDQARALIDRLGALGAVAQARGARAASLFEPRRHGLQKRLFIFATRHERAGESPALWRFEHQQHPFGAAEFGGFVDQELVQLVGAAQLVQAQAGVDQALEGLAEVGHHGEVGVALCVRQAEPSGIGEPGEDDLARHPRLVQEVAAQAFVAEAGDTLDHERAGLRQCFVRLGVVPARTQGLAVAPPQLAHLHLDQWCEVRCAVQFHGAPGRGQRRGGVARREAGPGGGREEHHPARVVARAVQPHRTLEEAHRLGCPAVEHCEVAAQVRAERVRRGCDHPLDSVGPLGRVGAGRRHVAQFRFDEGQIPELDPHHAVRAEAAADLGGLEVQPPRAPVQAQRAAGVAEVVDGCDPAEQGARLGVDGQCLVQLFEPHGEVGRVQGVERRALPEQVAAALRERQCFGAGSLPFGRATRVAQRRAQDAQRAAVPGGVSERSEERGRLAGLGNGSAQVAPVAHPALAQAREARGEQCGLAAASRRLQGRCGGGQHGRLAAPHLQLGFAVERDGLERRAAFAPGQRQHLGRVGLGPRELAGDEEALGAQVEQLHALAGVEARGLQCGGGLCDGFLLAAGPGQLGDRREHRRVSGPGLRHSAMPLTIGG